MERTIFHFLVTAAGLLESGWLSKGYTSWTACLVWTIKKGGGHIFYLRCRLSVWTGGCPTKEPVYVELRGPLRGGWALSQIDADERQPVRDVWGGQRHSKPKQRIDLTKALSLGRIISIALHLDPPFYSLSHRKTVQIRLKINSSRWMSGHGQYDSNLVTPASGRDKTGRARLLFGLVGEWQDRGGPDRSVKALTLVGVTSPSWDPLSLGQGFAAGSQWQFHLVSCHFTKIAAKTHLEGWTKKEHCKKKDVLGYGYLTQYSDVCIHSVLTIGGVF